jgi:ADP-heptose:LPS heptosyltransferase
MPGGGEGEHKRWGIQNFIALANLIKNKYSNAFFHFVVGIQEEEDMKQLNNTFDKNFYQIYMNASIPHILQIVQNSLLTIANDCGPSHLAQMCNGNYIGLWGWGNQNPIERIAEWTHKSEKSFALLADHGQDIKMLQPDVVFKKTNEIILGSCLP